MSPSYRPLRIGSLKIDFPVVHAALSGYSDWPMRVIASRLGAPLTFCEVMLDRFVIDVSKGRKASRYIRISDEERPCGAQLMGSDPVQFAAAAAKIAKAGFDIIDINFGCPVKKVLGKCRGGHLLSNPKTALQIVARVRDVVPPEIPVMVKMRRGMDDSQPSRDDFFTIFDGAFDLGVAAVTVHGRTVRQKYDGRSSWEFLRALKQHAPTRTVLGSGDLFTAQDCLKMLDQTGVDGVTAARGAIGNPWIFQQARDLAAGREPMVPSVRQQRDVLLQHRRLAEEIYPPQKAAAVMRTVGIKCARMHPRHREVRDAFIAVRNPDQWQEALDTWYGDAD